MNKRNAFIAILVIVLASLSLYLNRDRFKSEPVQIGDRSISPRGMQRPGQRSANTVVFILNQPLKMTAVRVVLASEIATNKYAHPLWELVSDSRSAPIKDFLYGSTIRGMKPSVKGAVADPLQPGVKYRLLVEAGSVKAEHDFTPAQPMP